MAVDIQIIGAAEKAAPFIPWAKMQWNTRQGTWYRDVGSCLINFKNVNESGHILFIVKEVKALVATPRNITGPELPQYSADSEVAKVYSVDFECDVEELTDQPEEFEQFYGNYHVVDPECEQVYSIYAPPHDLVGDIQENIAGYTRYSRTTSVSQEDIYTCYSEYVYQGGEPVIAGTMAPPEAAFKYGLIVGIGFNDKNELQLAQLVQIPQFYGYWKTEQGLKYGTNLPGELIWRNEDPDKKFFVEFFTGSGLRKEYTNIHIYDRKDGDRAANRQWFYVEGQWLRYSSAIQATYTFAGLKYFGSLLNTLYRLTSKYESLNDAPVSLTHISSSSSGVSGEHTEVNLAVKSVPWMSVGYIMADSWPADGSYYDVMINKGNCVDSITVTSTLINTTVAEYVAGEHYRITLHSRCVPNKSAQVVSGEIVVTADFGLEDRNTFGYTTKAGAWSSAVTTWQSPTVNAGDTLISDTIKDLTRTQVYRYLGARPSYQESVKIGYCRYCSNWTYTSMAYTTDPGSFSREPTYLLPVELAYINQEANITLAGAPGTQSCPTPPGNQYCPCCETYYVPGTMSRSFWYITSREVVTKWICT